MWTKATCTERRRTSFVFAVLPALWPTSADTYVNMLCRGGGGEAEALRVVAGGWSGGGEKAGGDHGCFL
jgi:hypothetical protein